MSNAAFHITVAAVVEQDGRYLMVEELIDGQLVYNQPAGHLEGGESLLDAVRREVLEETARDFTPRALLGIYRWQHPDKDETFIRFCFLGDVGEAHPGRALDTDIQRALWLTTGEIAARAERLRSPLVQRCIDDARQGCRHPLSLLNELA
jgi:ADP-ribose pyrophosphatase YjhB (NUDIX family)